MCCCCGHGGDHGSWRGRRHRHGHWYEHGHEHHGEHRHHRPHPHDDGPDRPPEWDRAAEDCGDERDGREHDGGGGRGRLNWNESYPFGFRRQFHARGEELELLQRYLDGLEKEAAAVREAIAQLQQPEEPSPAAGDDAPPAGGGETPPAATRAP